LLFFQFGNFALAFFTLFSLSLSLSLSASLIDEENAKRERYDRKRQHKGKSVSARVLAFLNTHQQKATFRLPNF
jgi:hypothetical protein